MQEDSSQSDLNLILDEFQNLEVHHILYNEMLNQ